MKEKISVEVNIGGAGISIMVNTIEDALEMVTRIMQGAREYDNPPFTVAIRSETKV